MKIFRKIATGVLALTLCTGMASINVGAVSSTYLKGDVDGDGAITMADLASMQQFLSGRRSAGATTIERLDVNRDYIIDTYDKTCLSNVLANSTSPTTLSYANTSALPSQSSRKYYICSPATGCIIPQNYYTLHPVSEINTSSNNPRGIIDGDDRYMEDGFEGVINVQYADGTNGGTAFVVDSHTLLTAAHVVYLQANLQFKIFSDYNTQSDIQITPVSYHVPSAYINGSKPWLYDYAIVRVQEDLSDYINFDLGVMRDECPKSKPIYVTGFGMGGGEAASELADVKSTGVGILIDTPDSSKNYAIDFRTDIVCGDSGSPVYVKNTDRSNSVIGICTYSSIEYNSCCRITNDILHFVYNNPYL